MTIDPQHGVPPTIHHLALAHEWAAATAGGRAYDRSTVDRSLAEEGFVHCSTPAQLRATADRYYAGRTDVVLLTIDTTRLAGTVVMEQAPSSGEWYPHVYGPIPLDAVVGAEPVVPGPDGRLVLP